MIFFVMRLFESDHLFNRDLSKFQDWSIKGFFSVELKTDGGRDTLRSCETTNRTSILLLLRLGGVLKG